MDECLPIFTTDYSVGGQSILTVDTLKNKDISLKDDEPNSILAIAETFDIKQTVLVENSFTGYWQAYKNFESIGREFLFGWKIAVATDASLKDDASELTESNIIIFLKNSDSYYKIVKWATKANCENSYKIPRLDWNDLAELYDEEYFDIAVPFYSSFISRNLLKYEAICTPKWGKIKPILLLQKQGLPFDELLKEATIKYAKASKFETMNAHQCYYLRENDVEAWQTFRCIQNRSVLNKPEFPHQCSNLFAYESYLKEYEPEKLKLL